ncbi:hypothetical protein [Mycoplasma sp. CSL10137]|uniref:hypothetical protein n=1 Tax=Mycoplasma sp. CSL10137 TaxID=2813824 RepID=UPI00197BF59B|nr:hypothetical protein [Mycoplasma sp. CSL10137]
MKVLQKVKYTYIIKRNECKNKFKKIISLGNTIKLKKLIKIILKYLELKLKKIDWTEDPKEIKVHLLGKLHGERGETIKEYVANDGITVIYKTVQKLKIFEFLQKSKHKNLEELLEYQIASRMINDNSVIKRFQTKDEFINSVYTK